MGKGLEKVVVVGRDAGAWLTALALQLSVAGSGDGTEIELIELPSALALPDVYATLPTQQAFHRLLGIDETRLLRACSGLYVLGQRFSNWSGSADPFLHAYDTHGVSLSQVDFFQHWLKARAGGLRVPLEDFSLGAAAAKQGRFVVFNDSTESFSNATYGYHLSAISYLRTIGKGALKAGVRHAVGEIASVEHSGGRIHSLRLRDGSTVAADLFVDASGPEGCLIRHLEQDNYESWTDWLPCDRLMAASAPVLRPVPAFSQVSAFREGWLGIYPLMNRTALLAAYSSELADDRSVAETLSALSGLRIEGDTIVSPTAAGARKAHWIGNCVAVGDTAVRLDPLDGAQLHLLQAGLSYLISFFPVNRDDMPEAALYNEKMESLTTGLRDFQISHYKLNRRFDEPFWDGVRDREVPGSLGRKLRLFESRGVVAMEEDETFQEENWTSIFVGHHLIPKTWDPLVDKVPEQEQIANFRRILGFIASEVEAMPSLQAHLELNSPGTSDYIF